MVEQTPLIKVIGLCRHSRKAEGIPHEKPAGQPLKTHRSVQVVDLASATASELDPLWRHEVCLWRDRLLWDISDTCAALRRLVGRRSLPGKAVRVGDRTVGYAYYGVGERLALIGGLVVLPDWNHTGAVEALLWETVEHIKRQGVSRIEGQFLSFDSPRLVAAFECVGFRTYWREFLRMVIPQARELMGPAVPMDLQPIQGVSAGEAAVILHAAYDGSVEAEIHARYRTVDGCRRVLDDIINQGGCGRLVVEASALARHRSQGVGLVVVTEVAPRHGHLTQVAVVPQYRRRGIGQLLLDHSVSRLVEHHFETFSLIVSRDNAPALGLYHASGLQSVLSFPVFVWEP
jgi:N-acetylglutamate synthase-like GNAT family acetyltransferase